MDQEYALAAKLAALMEAAGGPTYEALARDIREAGGPSVSAAYLWQLRTGARDNPTLQHLQALTRYFSATLGLPITLSYFDPRTPVDEPWSAPRTSLDPSPSRTDEAPEADEQDLGERLADLGVRRISARYGRLGSDVLREVLAVMEQLEDADGASSGGADAPSVSPAREG